MAILGALPRTEADVRKVRGADGVSIAYTVTGTGPTNLLALHGWGGAGSGHSWREVLKYLDLNWASIHWR